MTFNHGVRSSTLRWSTKVKILSIIRQDFYFSKPSPSKGRLILNFFKKISKKLLTNANVCGIICKYDERAPLAQKVEHMTFNHGVRSSTLRWSTKQKNPNREVRIFLLRSKAPAKRQRLIRMTKPRQIFWSVGDFY